MSVVAGCAKSDAPNRDAPYRDAPIILISIDTLRADAVSGFGADPTQTPEMLALGNEGIRFMEATAASHHTAPSHATILTGFSPFVHGVALNTDDEVFRIPKSLPTLAETLKAAGYATGGFTDGVQLIPARGFDRGFDVYEYDYTGLIGKLDRIDRFLSEHDDGPFFLFAHTYRAHAPYRVPLDRLDATLGDYSGVFKAPATTVARMSEKDYHAMSQRGKTHSDVERTAAIIRSLGPQRARSSQSDLQALRRIYDAGCTGADRELAQLVDLLKKHGLLERAIIVVTADHGEAFLEHEGAFMHRDLFDEVLRVPLIVRLPDGTGKGRRIHEGFSSVHLAPTLLDLVGVRSPVPLEGRSYARSLVGDVPFTELPSFAAMFVTKRAEPIMTAVRTPFFKRYDANVPKEDLPRRLQPFAPVAFFDLAKDPMERNNLAADNPDEMSVLGRSLERSRTKWAALRRIHGISGGTHAKLDEEALEALRALGYLSGK